MTIKNAMTNDYRIAMISKMETFGGIDLQVNFTPEITQLVEWWKEWKPVFDSKDPTVVDLLNQAKVLSKVV